MSNLAKKAKSKLIRNKDTKDKLDIYRAHFIEGEELDPRFEEYLEKLVRAKTMMTTGISFANTAKFLQSELNIGHAQSYNIIRDALELFGDITKINKDGMRYIMYENFMSAANLARLANDHGNMIRALDAAAKLYRLFEPQLDEIDAEQFAFPAQFIFTDNVNILNQAKNED